MKSQHFFKLCCNTSVIRNGPYCIIRVAYNTDLAAYHTLYRLIAFSVRDKVFETFRYVIFISNSQQNLKNNEELPIEGAVSNFIKERMGISFVIT